MMDLDRIMHVLHVIMQLRQWSYTLGYTLCFAVILAKTWRVYYIFTNPHSKKMVSVTQCKLKVYLLSVWTYE